MKFKEMKRTDLENIRLELQREYNGFKAKGLKLDMSRGKPCAAQLDISNQVLTAVTTGTTFTDNGTETRNYGGLVGIDEVIRIFSDLFGCPQENVITGENSSLHMMFDIIAQGYSRGLDGEKPWLLQGKCKFLCPSPGYDRHFRITEYFGMESIMIPMTETGPDMDLVEEYIKDPLVKGIWCVPKYSNPDGYSYSDETVRRFASLKPAAKDFRIMWDNAYAVHHLYEDKKDEILCLYKECVKRKSENMVLMFASTSKITHAGSGVCAVCASSHNIELMKQRMQFQTIGPDKVNQLRHARFLGSVENIEKLMKKHADIIRPKFQVVFEALNKELAPVDAGRWTTPNGGYFVSYYAPEGCAKKIVALCKEAGLVMTDAGAAYPYGIDPFDSNIRIAPTFPTVDELKTAMDLFTVVAKLVVVEKILSE